MLPTRQFCLRLLAWVLFVAPLAYVAYITSVVVHEIFGHGVVAWLVGGVFNGFTVLPDGMGWATSSSAEHPNIVLAGGVVSTTLLGFLLIPIILRRSNPLSRLAVLMFAVCMLQEGPPYGFWNSLIPRPPGDLGRILIDLDNDLLRWLLVVIFGAGWLASTVWSNIMVFRSLESIVGPLGRTGAILIASLLFGAGGGLAWFTFDWNQIIEDVGRLPQFVGAGLQVVMVPVLVSLRKEQVNRAEVSSTSWGIAISIAWTSCLAVILLLALWLRHGVSWD